MDTARLIVFGVGILLAGMFGACLTYMIMSKRFDAEIEEMYADEGDPVEEHTGYTGELTAMAAGFVPADTAVLHPSGPIRYEPPTEAEITASRQKNGYMPELDPLPLGEWDDEPTLIRLTRTTVTESVEVQGDTLVTDCDDALAEIRRRFDQIRSEIGLGLELVGSH